MDVEREDLDEAIRVDSCLPLAWTAMDSLPAQGNLLALNDSNLILLNAISFMETELPKDNDDYSGLAQEVSRLDAKVDLLISIVSRLAEGQQQLPLRFPISLSARTLRWSGKELAPAVGDLGVFELYLHPAVAVPMQLPAEIVDSGEALLRGLGVSVQNALEKYLFRQHRRAVAEARQAGQGRSS